MVEKKNVVDLLHNQTSVEIIHDYKVIVEIDDGKVRLSAHNDLSGDKWLLGVMTFNEIGQFLGERF